MFKQDDLACHVDGVVGVAGPLRKLSQDRVVNHVRANQVTAPRLANVHGVEVPGGGGGIIVRSRDNGANVGTV